MDHAVVVGLGQLGRLLGGGALRTGRRVTPVTRATPAEALDDVPAGSPVLVCTGEKDMSSAVSSLDEARRDDVCLVQNELFPHVWRAAGLDEPTVIVFWHMVKPQKPLVVGNPTQVFGKHATIVDELHDALDLPCEVLASEAERDGALVAKYALILAMNALGQAHDTTVGAWLDEDAEMVDVFIDEARALGEALLGHAVDAGTVRELARSELAALRPYPARGRTAAARVAHAHSEARRLDVELPTLGGVQV